MERRLWEAFRAGNRRAIERVYWEHVEQIETLVRVGLCRAGRFSPANLADVVQEVFAKAFSAKSRAAYDGQRDYVPFLRQTARNALIDWLRRQRREIIPALDFDDLVEGIASEEASQSPFAPELTAAVQAFVQGLEPGLRAVHERRFLAGESQERAAQALGISRQNLRTLERRLLDGLRRELHKLESSDAPVAFFQPNARPAPY